MGDRVTVGGRVDGPPRIVVTADGLAVATFRMRTRVERDARIRLPAGSDTGCVVVTALGELARAVRDVIADGDRIVVSGALLLRAPDENAAVDGTVAAEIHAEAIGLDIRT